MKLSIIMPTYNNLERLRITLKFLEKQKMDKRDFDVFLINDGSNDGTCEFLAGYKTDMRLSVINQENSGQARARNAGLLRADGEYILFMDDDVIAGEDFLQKHYEKHCEAGENIIVVGKINNIPFDRCQSAMEMAEGKAFHLQAFRELAEEDAYLNIRKWVWDNGLAYVKWLAFTTANASVKKSLLRGAGGFDEHFSGWGPEDVELGYRLNRAGADFRYFDEIENFHLDRQKPQETFYAGLRKNLRYLREQKYAGNREISRYIQFIGGQISVEELNADCSNGAVCYERRESDHYFAFLKYFLKKGRADTDEEMGMRA